MDNQNNETTDWKVSEFTSEKPSRFIKINDSTYMETRNPTRVVIPNEDGSVSIHYTAETRWIPAESYQALVREEALKAQLQGANEREQIMAGMDAIMLAIADLYQKVAERW